MSKLIPLILFLSLLFIGCQADNEDSGRKPQKGAASLEATAENGMPAAAPNPLENAETAASQTKNVQKPEADMPGPEKSQPSQDDTANAAAEKDIAEPAKNENMETFSLPEIADNDVPLTRQERERADRILAFSNQALSSMTAGYFALPDQLRKNYRHYLRTWRLPKRPKIPGRSQATRKITPPAGIFDQQEEKALAAGLEDMNRALEGMLGDYKDLEKYVSDDSIHDDGKLGRELADKLERGHGEYLRARRGWLAIVEANAARAEQSLLRQHPLQRQILAASSLFVQFREISDLLQEEKPDAAMIEAVRKTISSLIATAEKPPFAASPELERLYRGFLRDARQYDDILQRALEEGFFAPQKREIALAAQKCQKTYNRFAEMANRLRK